MAYDGQLPAPYIREVAAKDINGCTVWKLFQYGAPVNLQAYFSASKDTISFLYYNCNRKTPNAPHYNPFVFPVDCWVQGGNHDGDRLQ